MTRRWYLSTEAYQGLDVLSVCTEGLFGLEQASLDEGDRKLTGNEIDSRTRSCLKLINALRSTLEATNQPTGDVDRYLFQLAERLRMKMGVSPSDLARALSLARDDLERLKASNETKELLMSVCEEASTLAERDLNDLASISL